MDEIVPSVKNPSLEDMMRTSKIVNEEKDKDEQCSSSSFKKETKNVQERGGDAVADFVIFFRERENIFSLDLRPIGPSVFDGARSKAALRDEGYVWAPILWSSDNSKR